jgi:probable rRNA maturation factor
MPPRSRTKSRGSHPGTRKPETRRRQGYGGSPVSGIARPVRVHNAHPGLRADRRAVAAVIHLLDAHAPEIVGSPTSDRRSPTTGSGPATCNLQPLAESGPPPGELSIAFLPAAALARLHGKFLGDPSATDVITFAGAPAPGQAPTESGQAGEICVSAGAARAFARQHRRDFSEELTLYVVHGWLHLAGHDDLQPAKKRRMRAAEARAFRLLRAAGAVPRFRLA